MEGAHGGGRPGEFGPMYSKALFVVGVSAAMMTAFYMFRLVYLTFFNSDRVSPEAAHHIHENPKVMTVPLWILAIGSIAGGWVGLPKLWTGSENFWERWLEPTLYLPGGHGEMASVAHGAAAESAHAAAACRMAVMALECTTARRWNGAPWG